MAQGNGPIVIGVSNDSSGFDEGIRKGVIKPLEEAEGAFERLERAAGDADIDNTMDDASRATSDLADEIDDTRNSIRDLGRDADRADIDKPMEEGERAADDLDRALGLVDDDLRDIDRTASRTDVEKPLEDGEDAAGDLSKAVDDATDAVRDLDREASKSDLDDQMREAQKASSEYGAEIDETRRSLKELRDAAKQAGTGTKKAAQDGEQGMRRMGEGAEEVNQEILQNLSSTVSSFRGDMTDLVQLGQDVLGGLAGTDALGGIKGIAATAAGAAGLGLIVGAIEAAQQRAEEFNQLVNDIAQDITEAGRQGKTSYEAQADAIMDLATENKTAFDSIITYGSRAGITMSQLGAAYAEGGDKAEAVIARLQASMGNYGEVERSFINEAINAYKDRTKAIDEGGQRAKFWQAMGVNALKEQDEKQEAYTKKIEDTGAAVADVTKGLVDQQQAAIEAADTAREEAKEAALDSIAEAYDNVRDSALEAATSEEGVLDVSAWAESVEEHKKLVEEYKANLETLRLTPDQWNNLLELPEESRMQIVASLAKGPEDSKAKIVSALTDAGKSSGDAATVAFDNSFEPDTDVTIVTKADTAPASAALTVVSRQPRIATITAQAGGILQTSLSLAALAAKRRTATIDARLASTSGIDRDLARLARDRHARITVDANTAPARFAVDSLVDSINRRSATITIYARYGGTQYV